MGPGEVRDIAQYPMVLKSHIPGFAASLASTRFTPISRPQAAFCRRIASVTWHSAMEFPGDPLGPPLAVWPVFIALRRRAIFLALNHLLDVL
jgi:hypothetical protein